MLSEESPGWVKGPPVGHLGSGSSLAAASCSTSWEPVQEGEPMRSPSRPGCQGCCPFMWFQLASVIQDFKGSPAKESPACLPPPDPARVRSSARKLKAHAHNTRNKRSCRYTFSTSPQQSSSGAAENATLPPSTAGPCPLWVVWVIPEVSLAPPLRGFWTGLRGIHRNFTSNCCQASGAGDRMP